MFRDGPLPLERALAIAGAGRRWRSTRRTTGASSIATSSPATSCSNADGRDEAFLSDFGLVKELVVDDAVSGTGAVLGTSDYMPPEVLHGGVPDARSDVYALGCVLFEMLTGTPPFRRSRRWRRSGRTSTTTRRAWRARAASCRRALDGVIARALAKEPEERYGSAGDLAAAARAAAGGAAVEAPRRPRGTADVCPYKGLASFSEADADFFFGARSWSSSWSRDCEHPASWPSSARRAAASRRWCGRACCRRSAQPASRDHAGRATVRRAGGRAPGGAVLVVDQFEELFTLCAEEAERRAFVGRAAGATRRPVVIVVRADFYDRCWPTASSRRRSSAARRAWGRCREEALRRAITKPAQRVGLHLEHRLLETVVHDVAGQPGPCRSCRMRCWRRGIGGSGGR